MVRDVTVSFQGPGRSIEKIVANVPAEWISGDRDAMLELTSNEKLRSRIAVEAEAVLAVQISDPYDDTAFF